MIKFKMKAGTGTHSMRVGPNGMRLFAGDKVKDLHPGVPVKLKPGMIFECMSFEIPKSVMDKFERIGGTDSPVVPPAEVSTADPSTKKEGLTIRERGDGLFDVINSVTNEPINEIGLNKSNAMAMVDPDIAETLEKDAGQGLSDDEEE